MRTSRAYHKFVKRGVIAVGLSAALVAAAAFAGAGGALALPKTAVPFLIDGDPTDWISPPYVQGIHWNVEHDPSAVTGKDPSGFQNGQTAKEDQWPGWKFDGWNNNADADVLDVYVGGTKVENHVWALFGLTRSKNDGATAYYVELNQSKAPAPGQPAGQNDAKVPARTKGDLRLIFSQVGGAPPVFISAWAWTANGIAGTWQQIAIPAGAFESASNTTPVMGYPAGAVGEIAVDLSALFKAFANDATACLPNYQVANLRTSTAQVGSDGQLKENQLVDVVEPIPLPFPSDCQPLTVEKRIVAWDAETTDWSTFTNYRSPTGWGISAESTTFTVDGADFSYQTTVNGMVTFELDDLNYDPDHPEVTTGQVLIEEDICLDADGDGFCDQEYELVASWCERTGAATPGANPLLLTTQVSAGDHCVFVNREPVPLGSLVISADAVEKWNVVVNTPVYERDVWDIYNRDVWDIYNRDVWDIYNRDVWDIYNRDVWDIYNRDVWNIYDRDVQPVWQRTYRPVFQQTYQPWWLRTYQPRWQQEIQPFERPVYDISVNRLSGTLVTRLEYTPGWEAKKGNAKNTVPVNGGVFKNGHTFVELDLRAAAQPGGVWYEIADSSSNSNGKKWPDEYNTEVGYRYNVQYRDGKITISFDERLISASVGAYVINDKPSQQCTLNVNSGKEKCTTGADPAKEPDKAFPGNAPSHVANTVTLPVSDPDGNGKVLLYTHISSLNWYESDPWAYRFIGHQAAGETVTADYFVRDDLVSDRWVRDELVSDAQVRENGDLVWSLSRDVYLRTDYGQYELRSTGGSTAYVKATTGGATQYVKATTGGATDYVKATTGGATAYVKATTGGATDYVKATTGGSTGYSQTGTQLFSTTAQSAALAGGEFTATVLDAQGRRIEACSGSFTSTLTCQNLVIGTYQVTVTGPSGQVVSSVTVNGTQVGNPAPGPFAVVVEKDAQSTVAYQFEGILDDDISTLPDTCATPNTRAICKDNELSPVYNDRTINPVYNDHKKDPVYNDHKKDPVYNDRTIDPVYNDRTIAPVYNDRPANPKIYDDPIYLDGSVTSNREYRTPAIYLEKKYSDDAFVAKQYLPPIRLAVQCLDPDGHPHHLPPNPPGRWTQADQAAGIGPWHPEARRTK